MLIKIKTYNNSKDTSKYNDRSRVEKNTQTDSETPKLANIQAEKRKDILPNITTSRFTNGRTDRDR